MKKVFILLITYLCVSINSCSIFGLSELEFKNYMDENINKLSYDQALMEWGVPDQVINGDEIQASTWDKRTWREVYNKNEDKWISTTGFIVTVCFDKTSKKMLSWKLAR